MKQRQLLAVFSLAATLGTAALLPASAQEQDNLIIPGKSIGQTHLGSNGNVYLKKLPKPNAIDVGMSQTRQVWVSKKGGRTDTLFIHTVSNGALGVQPTQGVTIDTIRVTSPWFHTQNGLSTGNTKAKILRNFPNAHSVEGYPKIYDDSKRGIAFEFGESATASPCIAIMIHPPGNVHLATSEQVNQLLRHGEHP